ncbi:MAG: hypothetical protein IIA87_01435 [Nanoarchaeota archaeon]|nr:hypothetical protein [Nanoarchaeota archaeon]
MSEERITYVSRAQTHQLDPARVFEVVADINKYLHSAVSQAQKDNPNDLRPASSLRGDGRTLALSTEAVNQPGFLESFDLAELVLAEDNSKLTLDVKEHPRVAIPSDGLHYVVSKYVLRK